jgi:hypothetical protein
MAAVAERISIQQNDPTLVEWAGRISLDQIPGLLAFLTTRLLAETTQKPNAHYNALPENASEELLTASELAKHFHLAESWVWTEERLGRIASVRLGKYVRFKLSEVECTLAKIQRRRR